MSFFEVSAKTGDGIQEMFNELARQIVTVVKPKAPSADEINLNPKTYENK